MQDVAVAFSGGGLTSVLSTFCTIESLYKNNDVVNVAGVSGISGGLLGYSIYENGELEFPDYLHEDPQDREYISFEELFESKGQNESHVWFSEIKDLLPTLIADFDQLFADGPSGVWANVVGEIFRAYNINLESLALNRLLVGGTGFFKKVTQPFPASDFDSQGFLKNASEHLLPAWFYLNPGNNTGTWEIRDNQTIYTTDKNSLFNTTVYGTSVWQASVLTSNTLFQLASDALLEVNLTAGGMPNMPGYLIDGGVIDSTGIVNALRLSRSNIISHYFNNAGELQDFDVPFSVLFGVAPQPPTNTANNLPGPNLLQVFPSSRYPEFLSQVDSGLIHLQNLTTVQNTYLGIVGGRLISNLIVSTLGNSEAFFDSLTQNTVSEIEAMKLLVGENWPAGSVFPVSNPQANLFCDFAAFKAEALKNLISSLLP